MQNNKGCWRQCIAATVALFCSTGLNINAFSVFIPYLTDILDLSYSQNATFLFVRNIASFLSIFFVRIYYEKLDIKFGLALSVLLAALAMFLYSKAEYFGMVCVAATISGLAYGWGGMYPAALLIQRWFVYHSGLAMGICAAGTGLAIIVGAPVLTALAESSSAQTTLLYTSVFLAIIAVVCVILIKNSPADTSHIVRTPHKRTRIIKFSWVFCAVMAIGAMGNTGYSNLTMLYSVEGFDPYRISVLISILGLVLAVGKFLLGEVIDLWGAKKANRLFFTSAIIGCALFGLGGRLGYIPALMGASLFGFGDSVATVGLTVYAKDFSTREEFAQTQQQYQMAFMLGGLISSPLPGLIATWTGDYRVLYYLITALAIFAMFVIQKKYKAMGK